MTIPDETFWSALACVGGIVGWLLKVERSLSARMTRKEHSEICDRSNDELSKKLDTINRKLDRQDETAAKDRQTTLEHRQWVGDSLADIRTKVAVLRERLPPRSGDTDDTGAHRRRL